VTILDGGDEGSLLPPARRDIKTPGDLTRAHDRNLARLSPGFGSGRIPNAALVQSGLWAEDSLTDTGESADDTMIVWEWNDRHTVSAAGTQTAHLTYEPLDESLVVLWHPGGAGGVPITEEHFVLDGQTVTIPDPGFLVAGDQFSFQYPHNPGLEEGFIPAEILGTGCLSAAVGSSLDLPDNTEPGSLMVLATTSFGTPAVFTDPRFSQVYSANVSGVYREVFVGTEDGSGDPISITLVSTTVIGYAGLTVLSPGSSLGSPTVTTLPATPDPYTFTSITAHQALGVLFPQFSVVPGPLFGDSDGDWESGALCGYGQGNGAYVWTTATGEAAASPPGEITYGGFPNGGTALTFPLTGPGEV